jgi:hypothetical protein
MRRFQVRQDAREDAVQLEGLVGMLFIPTTLDLWSCDQSRDRWMKSHIVQTKIQTQFSIISYHSIDNQNITVHYG